MRLRLPGVAWVVGLVALSSLLALLFSAHPESFDGPVSAGPDSYSYSLIGYRAGAMLLERSGFEVVRRRTLTTSHAAPGTMVIATEPGPGDTVEFEDSEWASDRHRTALTEAGAQMLVILPKWEGVSDPSRPRWVTNLVPVDPHRVRLTMERYGIDSVALVSAPLGASRFATSWGESVLVDVPHLRVFAPAPELRPIVWRDSLVLIAMSRQVGVLYYSPHAANRDSFFRVGRMDSIYVASDPDLFNNRGLARGDHALLLRRFLQEDAEVNRIVFDELVHHGAYQSSLAAALLRFPLVLAVIQSLLLLSFLAWAFATRFGSPRPLEPRPASRAALVEAASRLLTAAGSPVVTLQIYWAQVLRDTAVRLGRPAGQAHRDWLRSLSELGRGQGVSGDALQFEHEVEVLQRGDRGTPEAVLRLAVAIHHWHREMVHGR